LIYLLLRGYVVVSASFFTDLLPTLGCLNASIAIHNIMLRGVLRSRLKFFDTTPIGRILSRFSADVSICDNNLPQEVYDVAFFTFQVISGCEKFAFICFYCF